MWHEEEKIQQKIGYVICVLPKVRGYIWSDLTLSLATYVNKGSTYTTALATLGLSIKGQLII